MKIARKKYQFANASYTLRIFAHEQAFRQHLKHFRDANQPWHCIHALRDIRSLCQKSGGAAVTHIYECIVPVLDKAIRFSLKYPLYVDFYEQTEQRTRLRRKQILLSNYGFVVVCNEKAVLSAYYKTRTQIDSAHVGFEQAWREIRYRCEKQKYVHENETTVTLKMLTRHSNEHWDTMPEWNTIAPTDLDQPRPTRKGFHFQRPDVWDALPAMLNCQ
jgi:hypothetical protein